MEKVFLDGELVAADRAGISISAEGFLYGASLFETLRVYGGRPFRLEAHLLRMERSAGVLGFSLRWDRSQMEEAVAAVLRVNALQHGRLRITLYRGEPGSDSHLLVRASAGVPYREYQWEAGVSAVISPVRMDPSSLLAGHKTGNYLPHLLAREDARRRGAEEAILLNTNGKIAEGSASNLFLVLGGGMATPDPGSGILPGITRSVVMELACGMGIAMDERALSPEELLAADEAFLTNSLMEVMPLVAVDGRPIGGGSPGPITRALQAAYRSLTASELSS